MHLVYRQANGNGRETISLHSERYLNRRIPTHKLFANLHRRLCESGSFRINAHYGRDRISRTPKVEAVEEAIERNSRTNTRTIARHIGIH